MNEDTLIFFGDAIKALDENGRVGALGIRFSNQNRKDLHQEFFTEKTYLGPSDGDGQECIFDHGFPVAPGLDEFADHTFAPVKAKRDKLGVWVETVLDLSDEYEKAVFELAKKGKLGWSSGSSGHRVRKDPKTGEIKSWPVSEWSLTMRPAEPDNYGTVIPVKSLASVKFVPIEDDDEDDGAFTEIPVKANSLALMLTKHIEDRVDNGHTRESIVKSLARESGLDTDHIETILAGEAVASIPNLKAFARVLEVSFEALKSAKQKDYSRTIKGMFEEVLADRTPSRWELDSVYSDIIRKLAATAQASAITGVKFDLEAKVKEATEEYMSRLQSHAVAQINEYVESGSDEPFYLKAIIDISADLPVSGHLDLESHSQLAVSALRDVIKRFWVNHENRKRETPTHKAGRVLSQANRTRLSTMLEQIQAAVSDCQKLLDESTPKASDEEKRAVISQQLRLEQRARQLGSPAI